MVDEAASSIVVDEATAINTNAVQQLTVSDHPRVRRNSTGDDGIHYYENHESLLLEPRFVTLMLQWISDIRYTILYYES